MILVIAEKPSVAKTIATILNATQTKQGYIQGNGYCVTWAFGHLVEFAQANSYVENPWKLTNIPIIPSPFELEVKNDSGAKKQFNIIKNLFQDAQYVINATDAGREGELIFRYIQIKANATSIPVKRLWISSLTNQAIKQGFENLIQGNELDNLFLAGKARSQADWIVGINATIALTLISNSPQRMSLGRVQTPTFSMVAKRYLEHINFKPTPYFNAQITILYKDQEFKANAIQKFENQIQANQYIEQVKNTIICTDAQIKKKSEKQPLLFDLTSLQIQANNSYGFTAQQTLTITQSLYEKNKAVTYPRTDSKFLTQDMYAEMPKLLNSIFSHKKELDSSLFDLNNLPKKSINDKKVTDHHAIIPTLNIPKDLSEQENKIYQLITNQFLAAFAKECEKTLTTYTFGYKENPEICFKSNGTVINTLGWRTFINKDTKDTILPNIILDQIVNVKNKEILKKMTSPKPLLTESTLLKLMEGCGKEFDENQELPKEIKDMGIGRPATRASIIERIIQVDYVSRDKKNLIPTEKGIKLYNLIKDFNIASAKMTGLWESKLNAIAQGNYSYDDFMELVEKNFRKNTLPELLKLKGTFKGQTINCPKCNQNSLQERGKVYRCTENQCDFVIFQNYFEKKLSLEFVEKLINKQKIEVKGLLYKKNKFDAILYFDTEELKIKHQFKDTTTNINCPKCKTGKLKKHPKGFYGCNQYNTTKCDFSIWEKQFGKKLNEKQITELCTLKKTSKISGFKSQKTKKTYSASLELKNDFKIGLIFDKKKK